MQGRQLLFALFLVFLTLPSVKSISCGRGWTQGFTADKCISAFSAPTVWSQAEQNCELWGGYLASVGSSFENTYMASYAKKALNGAAAYWLGGSTLDSQVDPYVYNWTWTDGSVMTYNNFAKDQLCVIYDDCCLTQNSSDSYWYIQTCEHNPPQLPYICELVAPTTVAPPTTTPWPGNCPNGWDYNSANQKCYYPTMVDGAFELMTFNDTVTYCQSNFGADLVSIHSQADNDWVVNFINKVGDQGVAWIGIYDPHVNGNWQWHDGSTYDYKNWGQIEPSPGTYSAYISSNDFTEEQPPLYKGKWYGQDLDLMCMGICVLPAKGSTEPTRRPTTAPWNGKCDPGWEYYDAMKKCYRNLQFDMVFDDCRTSCQTVDADLPTIHNSRENELLTEFLVLSATNEAGLQSWIGLYSPNLDGNFKWIDGSPLNYTAWGSGEPQKGTYAALLDTQRPDRGKWTTLASNYLVGCFCAKDSY